MRHLLNHVLRWACGGLLYGLLEVLWRGYTHWTMLVLAWALCIPLDIANEHLPWDWPLWLQALVGGTVITAAELASGLILNVWLGLNVWNYSPLPGNLWGQICPQFWLLWCLLSAPVILLFDWLCYWLDGGARPTYRLI